MDLSPGAVVAGRFRADARLGLGAMGEVWSGVHIDLGVPVALKRLLPAGRRSHEQTTRFKREAHLLGRVRSDHVARIYDFLDDKDLGLVLVMELVEGRSLYDVLQNQKLSYLEAIDLGLDLANGVADLHEAEIIHRDLKPGNVILERRSRGRPRARIVDFGMSRAMTHGGDDEVTGITRADVALGTLEYMAPEQMLDSRAVGGGTDIYAMGAILFRAVAGRHAYTGDTEQRLARNKLMEDAPRLVDDGDEIALGLADVVARAMRRKPQERYASAVEMLEALEKLRARASTPLLFEDTTTNHFAEPPRPSAQEIAPAAIAPSPTARSQEPSTPLPVTETSVSQVTPSPKSSRGTSFALSIAAGMAIVIALAAVALRARSRLAAVPEEADPAGAPTFVVSISPASSHPSATVQASVSAAPIALPTTAPAISASSVAIDLDVPSALPSASSAPKPHVTPPPPPRAPIPPPAMSDLGF